MRGAGFAGCGALDGAFGNVVSTFNTSAAGSVAPVPLGNYAVSSGAVPITSFVQGYDATSSGAIVLTSLDPANDTTLSDWSPALDPTLSGDVIKGSDVLVMLGPQPGTAPTGVTATTTGLATIAVQSTSAFTSAGGVGAISDCGKTELFGVTALSSTTITHNAGSGPLGNSSAVFGVNFNPGAQVIPMQLTALFVGNNTDGHPALMYAVYGTSGWTVSPLIPGVDAMAVQYGTGSNFATTGYVPASSVTDWTSVYSIRISLLVEGQAQAVSGHSTAANTFSMLGTSVTAPADGVLRHVDDLTINLRNL